MANQTANQANEKASSLHLTDLNLSGLLHLLVVYVVWGSTYLAIRVGVREGAGFPPFMMGAMRMLAGGGLLILWAVITRQRIRLTWREIGLLAASGLLLWSGGNGLVMWAEQRIISAFAALIISATPIWVAVIEAIIDRKMPSLFFVISLLTGFAGIGVLVAPVLISGVKADILGVLALLLATISWGSGSILQKRQPVHVTPQVSSAYQHLFGGLGFILALLFFKEPLPTPTAEAWIAWGYLVVIGSVFAFTSYVQAIRLLPMKIVVTYAYVNPVIAMFLGWLILREPLTIWTYAGAALVLLGVAGIFRSRQSGKAKVLQPLLQPVADKTSLPT